MIWLLTGVAILTSPTVYAMRTYGGPPEEAVERMMFSVSFPQLEMMDRCVRFGALVAGYGLMRVLT